MAFPFTVNGTVAVPIEAGDSECIDRVIRNIVAGLDRARARQVKRMNGSMTFRVRGGVIRGISTWLPTFAVSSGTLTITANENHVRISYRLRLTELVIYGSMGILLFLAPPILLAPDSTPTKAAGILAFIWLFGVGGNYPFTRSRFRT